MELTAEQILAALDEWRGEQPTLHSVWFCLKDERGITITVDLPMDRRYSDKEAIELARKVLKNPDLWVAKIPITRRKL